MVRTSRNSFKMDVPAHFTAANIEVREDAGKVALVKGPFVYCLEQTDNGRNLASLYVSTSARISQDEPVSSLPGKLPALKYSGSRLVRTLSDSSQLYGVPDFIQEEVGITAVPYCLWCNREPGEMLVWQKARI